MKTNKIRFQGINLIDTLPIIYNFENLSFERFERLLKESFNNVFTHEGRIRRTEFTISLLIFFIVQILIFETALIGDYTHFLIILSLPLFYFLFIQGSKRCHDRGNSGWFQLVPFYIFWMLLADSQYGVNKYGLNPKGVGNPIHSNLS